MEFEIKIMQEAGKIEIANSDELEEKLADYMEQYKDAEFTEESKGIAKKISASLKKRLKAVDDRRKLVKSAWMQPYYDFEVKVNRLKGLIEEPIQLIDSQVAVFEEKRKQEKREKITLIYNQAVGDLAEWIPLEKVYNPKWENATAAEKSIREEIEKAVETVENGITAINGMQSAAVGEALDIFKDTLDLSRAIAHINQYEKNKADVLAREQKCLQEEEERRHRQELERIREEERKRIREEEHLKEAARKETMENLKVVDEYDNSDFSFHQKIDVVKAVYSIAATAEQLEQLEMYMDSVGIFYEKKNM